MIFTFFTGFSRTFGLKSRTNHGFSREHTRADSRNLEQTRNVEQTRNLEQMAWQSSNVATLKKCLAYASLGRSKAKRGELNSVVVTWESLIQMAPKLGHVWTSSRGFWCFWQCNSEWNKDYALLPPRGYSSFSMADGREILIEGRKEVQLAVQCGEVLKGSLTVTDVSKPLLSVGRMIEAGSEIVLNKVRPHIKFESGRSTRIFYDFLEEWRVYKLPVWIRPFAGPGTDL